MLLEKYPEKTTVPHANLPEGFEKGQVFTPKYLADWAGILLAERLARNRTLTVLDPACGDGELLLAIQSSMPRAKLIGVDIDPVALSDAQKRLSKKALLIRRDMLVFQPNDEDDWQSNVDAIISNPPWGADTLQSSTDLRTAGFTLATGQYDSWSLFLELSLRLLRNGGYAVFILPDSIFAPEHAATRRMLTEQYSLEVIARLGEGIFKGVFRGTVLILVRKSHPVPNQQIEILRLSRTKRQAIIAGYLTLQDARTSDAHRVLQSRFLADGTARWDIDVRTHETRTLEKIEAKGGNWADLLVSGRGVEISKKGAVRTCTMCNYSIPAPTKPRTVVCRSCGSTCHSDEMLLNNVTRPVTPSHDGYIPFVVGEDIGRYQLTCSRELALNVAGLNYKTLDIYASERLLVRKTGVGLKATLTDKNAATNQVVFHFSLKNNLKDWDFYLPYILGVMSSRIMFAYHLRKSGESEWRSHPYVTPKTLRGLPIPVPEQGTQNWMQAHMIAQLVRQHLKTGGRDNSLDLKIECLVAGLFDMSSDDIVWAKHVISSAQDLEPMRALGSFDETSVSAERVQ